MTKTKPAADAPVAHLIYEEYGELRNVTLDDTEAEMAEAEGLDVTTNATAAEIVDYVAPLAASDYMDDKTWQTVAPAMKALADQLAQEPNPYDRSVQIMAPTSPELPEDILSARISALARIFDARFDLQAYVELQELSFARAGNRKANEALFTEESWNTNWEDIYQEDLDVLDQRADALSEMMAEHASEAAAFGDGPVGSHRKDVLARLDIFEIDYAATTWFAEEEKVDLGDQDVPY